MGRRIVIEIDSEACTIVMRRFRMKTRSEAVNFARWALAAEPLGLDDARRMRGSIWEGYLSEMRTARTC